MLFKKKNSKKDVIDLSALERKLRKAKKEVSEGKYLVMSSNNNLPTFSYCCIFFCFPQKPSSVQLYNQIGNFWRIKGHTLRAIECFRRALAVAPNNPEVSSQL